MEKQASESRERTMIDFQSRLGLRRNQALSTIKGSAEWNKKEGAFHERDLWEAEIQAVDSGRSDAANE